MSGTKILWGQVIVVGLIVLLAIWGATEWTAWRLAYQPELGRAGGFTTRDMMRRCLPLAAIMYGLMLLFMFCYWPLVGPWK